MEAAVEVEQLGGVPLHDPVAVAQVIDPGLVSTRPALIEVDCGWEQGRGRTNVDFRGRLDGGDPNARVGVDIDHAAFVRLVTGRIASLG